jgi:hypothetical protein
MAQLVLDASVAFMLGNSTLPPTKEEMLSRDPEWLEDVFTTMALLRFQLDAMESD